MLDTKNAQTVITARMSAGLSQRELAALMGVSQPFVAAFERGKKPWPAERVAQALREIEQFERPVTDEQRERDRACIQAIIDQFNAVGWPR